MKAICLGTGRSMVMENFSILQVVSELNYSKQQKLFN